jgi:hypothetical protein
LLLDFRRIKVLQYELGGEIATEIIERLEVWVRDAGGQTPPISSAADAATAAAALLEAVAVGDLTPSEASEVGKLIEAYVKALEAADFAERLDKLEAGEA